MSTHNILCLETVRLRELETWHIKTNRSMIGDRRALILQASWPETFHTGDLDLTRSSWDSVDRLCGRTHQAESRWEASMQRADNLRRQGLD